MTFEMPAYATLQLSIEEHVATVLLNRPDKANSMNLAMWSELQACFDWLDAEIDIGMAADVGTLQRLPKIIPDPVARELAYTGRNMGAQEAREVGYLNRVFPDAHTMMKEVTAIARTIAEKSPLAVRSSKEMLLYTRDHSVADGLDHVAIWNAGMLSYTDLQEGLQAQMEKRQAVYED